MGIWNLAALVLLPMAAAPVSWLIGRRDPGERDLFVLSLIHIYPV